MAATAVRQAKTGDSEMACVGEQDPEMAAIDDPGSAEIVPGDVEPEDFGVLTAGAAEAGQCLNPLRA